MVIFASVLAIWFYFLSIGEPQIDPIKHSEEIRDNWIIVAILIGGLWILLFPKKPKPKPNTSNDN
jgi:hypothetical protein